MRLSGCYYHIFPPVYSTPTLPRSYVTYCDLVLMVGSFQTSSYTAIGKLLPQSANTICGWILDHYHSARETLQTNLRWTHTAVHITFDVWTSPNHRSFLGVVGHYYDYPKNETRQVLLGFRRIVGAHTGENIASCFWDVATTMGLERRLVYFTMDNASNNDTALSEIALRCSAIGVPFQPRERRLRCFGHILNLTVKAFLWGENPTVIETSDSSSNTEDEMAKLLAWRKRGPLGKLYNW